MTDRRADGPRAPSPALFLVVALLVPAILVSVSFFLRAEYTRAGIDRQRLQASVDLNLAALGVQAAIRQAETAQRGFILTRDPQFLYPYEPARQTVQDRLAQYRRLATDEPVRELVDAKFAEMDQVLSLGREGQWERAAMRIADGEGLALMQRIERLMQAQIDRNNRLTTDERRLFLARSAAIEWSVWVFAGVATVALITGLILLWRLRRDRWAALIQAHATLTRHRAILDSTSDAIVILNPSGSIEQANAATFRLLGHDAAALERRDVSRILDIAQGEGTFHERIGFDGQTLQSHLLTDRIAHPADGRSIPVDVALGLMPLPDGVHIVASIRDISERKAVERMKDEFVATVSHELRTPLTSVVGSLGLLRAGVVGALPPAAHELVAIAENNTRRLIRLTNDILDLDKLGSGNMVFEFDDIDLVQVAAEAAETYQASAAARGVRIVLEGEGSLMIHGDRQRLLQAIGNLLSNAIRHTPERSVVTIGADQANGRAVLRISDQGAGVPLEFRDRIFDRFGQVPSAHSSGTGLGLAIVREIIARHDGQIWYESGPAGGAVFAFSLDRVRKAVADTLMLLSDDHDTIERVTALVEAEGLRVEAVASIEAIESAARANRRPALFLFDLDMATDHKTEIWTWLNCNPDLGDVPRAIISHSLLECETALPFEIIGWFSKPIDDAAMRATVNEALARRRKSGRHVVLHVDDDRDLALVMQTLWGAQCELLFSYDLASARAILAERRPDIVILDLALPDGSGVELLPDLIDAAGCPIPVVVHSAQTASEDVIARAAAVVTKSRTALPELRNMVRRIVDPSEDS